MGTPHSTKPVDPDLKRLQQNLANQIHLPVNIRCNARGKGSITIHYKNLTELANVLAYFQVMDA